MKKINPFFGKLLYGMIFLVAIPLLQVWWAKATEHIIRYPAVNSATGGVLVASAGLLLILWGMFALKKFGNGLPMNAYPPGTYVSKGPYNIFHHPIYWGYGILSAGVSIYYGSASGLWLVTPVSILAMIALVLGYEKIDLAKRFKGAQTQTMTDIPLASNKAPLVSEKFAAAICVLALIVVGNFITWKLTKDTPSLFPGSLIIEKFPDSNTSYAAVLFIAVFTIIVSTKTALRRWMISSLIAISLSLYISLLLPSLGAQYFPATPASSSIPAVLFSTTIALTLVTAHYYLGIFPKYRLPLAVLTMIICGLQLISTDAVLINLLAGIFIYTCAVKYEAIWSWLRISSEKIANSWKEWTIGPVRIINHGFYVGLGAFLGILVGGFLVGSNYAWGLLAFAFVVTVCSALWAQLIEGSEKLKRPFGYYGALAGIIFASLLVWAMGYNVWVLIGVISVFMPWVQAAGRLRCLVNGCCHGSEIHNAHIGIRYFHPRSRVCGLSHMKGKLLHPTQLYSILWLSFTGCILLALWDNGLPYSFIFGAYLMLTGLGRFVEEAYRGEVQTPILNGLRLYQWAALFSFIIGIVMTTIPVTNAVVYPDYGWQTWLSAAIGGLFIFFSMGVDFPNSNYRFSRLV